MLCICIYPKYADHLVAIDIIKKYNLDYIF